MDKKCSSLLSNIHSRLSERLEDENKIKELFDYSISSIPQSQNRLKRHLKAHSKKFLKEFIGLFTIQESENIIHDNAKKCEKNNIVQFWGINIDQDLEALKTQKQNKQVDILLAILSNYCGAKEPVMDIFDAAEEILDGYNSSFFQFCIRLLMMKPYPVVWNNAAIRLSSCLGYIYENLKREKLEEYGLLKQLQSKIKISCHILNNYCLFEDKIAKINSRYQHEDVMAAILSIYIDATLQLENLLEKKIDCEAKAVLIQGFINIFVKDFPLSILDILLQVDVDVKGFPKVILQKLFAKLLRNVNIVNHTNNYKVLIKYIAATKQVLLLDKSCNDKMLEDLCKNISLPEKFVCWLVTNESFKYTQEKINNLKAIVEDKTISIEDLLDLLDKSSISSDLLNPTEKSTAKKIAATDDHVNENNSHPTEGLFYVDTSPDDVPLHMLETENQTGDTLPLLSSEDILSIDLINEGSIDLINEGKESKGIDTVFDSFNIDDKFSTILSQLSTDVSDQPLLIDESDNTKSNTEFSSSAESSSKTNASKQSPKKSRKRRIKTTETPRRSTRQKKLLQN